MPLGARAAKVVVGGRGGFGRAAPVADDDHAARVAVRARVSDLELLHHVLVRRLLRPSILRLELALACDLGDVGPHARHLLRERDLRGDVGHARDREPPFSALDRSSSVTSLH